MWFKFGFKRVLWFTVCIALAVGILCIDCIGFVEERAVPGKYASNTFVADSIFIYTNHAYVHRYLDKKKHIYENRGRWEFKEKHVFFTNFKCYVGECIGQSGDWQPRVSYRHGKVSLIYAEDSDIYYAKQ